MPRFMELPRMSTAKCSTARCFRTLPFLHAAGEVPSTQPIWASRIQVASVALKSCTWFHQPLLRLECCSCFHISGSELDDTSPRSSNIFRVSLVRFALLEHLYIHSNKPNVRKYAIGKKERNCVKVKIPRYVKRYRTVAELSDVMSPGANQIHSV